MKLKALTVGLALSFPMLASAQGTSVTLYGNIDTAIEYVNNISDGAGGSNSSVHFTNLTSSWTSYWGLRGTEKLSDNLSAVFNLESGFNPGTGTSQQGGRLFGRQAWVGLKGDWGQLAFGRQYNMMFWANIHGDIMGPNAYGLAAIDPYFPNTRMDNSVTYRGNFNGFTFGAAWARGRDNVNAGGPPSVPATTPPTTRGTPSGSNCGVDYDDNSACGAYSFMAGYNAAGWGVNAAYDVITGQDPAGGNFYGLGQDDKDRRILANAYVKWDSLKVALTYLNRKNDGIFGVGGGLGNRSDLWSLGAAYGITPAVTVDGAVNYVRYKNAAAGSQKVWYYVARVKYSLSKRTSVHASAAYMDNDDATALSAASGTAGINPNVGQSQTAVMAGLRHIF
jgi:predicted porin